MSPELNKSCIRALRDFFGFSCRPWGDAASKTPIPAAKVDQPLASTPGKETAVFAGGCFWGTQAVFERVEGVIHTTAVYAGGVAATATYAQERRKRLVMPNSLK